MTMLVKGVDDAALHNNLLKVGETWLSHAPLAPKPPMSCHIAVLKGWTMWLSIHDDELRVDETWPGHAP